MRPEEAAGGRLPVALPHHLGVSSSLRAFVGQMFPIPSESMEGTLLKGDRVVGQESGDIQRGDVVFQDPVDRLLAFVGFPTAGTPGQLIKRVIGLPGDGGHHLRADRSPTTEGLSYAQA